MHSFNQTRGRIVGLAGLVFSIALSFIHLAPSFPVLFRIKIDRFVDPHPQVATRALEAENLLLDRFVSLID